MGFCFAVWCDCGFVVFLSACVCGLLLCMVCCRFIVVLMRLVWFYLLSFVVYTGLVVDLLLWVGVLICSCVGNGFVAVILVGLVLFVALLDCCFAYSFLVL